MTKNRVNGSTLMPDRPSSQLVEKTTAQVLFAPVFDGRAPRPIGTGEWLEKVRKMRRDPTLGFARDLVVAPLLSADWTVETDSDPNMDDEDLEVLAEAEQFISRQMERVRSRLLRDAVNGMVDYGWQSFERILEIVEDEDDEDKEDREIPLIGVNKLKPLLPDFTEIVIDEFGNFLGVFNYPLVLGFGPRQGPGSGPFNTPIELPEGTRTSSPPRTAFAGEVFLDDVETVLFTRAKEGNNWYGEPMLRRAEYPYDRWQEADGAAERYYNKLAGAHWVVYYPIGTSEIDGEEVDNSEIASRVLQSLKSSGMVAVPQEIIAHVDDLNSQAQQNAAWKIEILAPSGANTASFTDREKHLEALMARALNLPERAVFEGQFGTKAESESHADFAISLSEMWHVEIVREINEQVVDDLVEVNWGKRYRGRVRLAVAPLTDSKRAVIQGIYTQLLSTPDGLAEEFDRIDMSAMREKIGIPSRAMSDEEEQELDQKIEEKRDAITQQMTGGGEGGPEEGMSGPAEEGDEDDLPGEVDEFVPGDEEDTDDPQDLEFAENIDEFLIDDMIEV